MFSNLSKKYIAILITIFILISLCATLPFPWNEPIADFSIDVLFKIRGSRALAEEIILVFIGDKDVEALGGWPLSRDYYSYLIHILQSQQARVVGLDILFTNPDRNHPEYDRILADFIKSSGNICIPFTFSELKLPKNAEMSSSKAYLEGINLTQSLPSFVNNCATQGFSNFEHTSNVRKVPLLLDFNDQLVFSFGLQLARSYLKSPEFNNVKIHGLSLTDLAGNKFSIPVDNLGRLRLNHFGESKQTKSISLIDLIRDFRESSNRINLKDKLVITAVTASGITNIKSTPLSSTLPASLIHATIAENCIHQNFLVQISIFWQWLILLVTVIGGYVISKINNALMQFTSIIGFVTFYIILSTILFSVTNLILPVFYPVLASLTTLLLFRTQMKKQQLILDSSITILLNEQIFKKEQDLEDSKIKLAALEEELKNKSRLSEQSNQLAGERKNTILQLEKELNDLKIYSLPENHYPHLELSEIIYTDKSPMRDVMELISKIRNDDIPVLISGETGSGKELIARAIHQSSQRKNAPFIALNCGALSETLLESELFGHERGSFTGAHTRRKGRFELANKGTIFLDEITETSSRFQSRLLRVLQEKTFERLGGEDTIHTDVRIIAATNKIMSDELENERFRSDLFFRLNGFPILLPSLKDRIEDIPLLVLHFLKKYKFEKVAGFSDRAMEILESYHWPGNVRELENTVRRVAILAESEHRKLIKESDIPNEIYQSESLITAQSVHFSVEKQILSMLQKFKFSHTSISQTAKALGNKDRGTITEYFRGICFEQLVISNFNIDETVKNIAGTTDQKVLTKVKSKITDYLNNLKSQIPNGNFIEKDIPASVYKGLPKKYHSYLDQVLNHLRQDI